MVIRTTKPIQKFLFNVVDLWWKHPGPDFTRSRGRGLNLVPMRFLTIFFGENSLSPHDVTVSSFARLRHVYTELYAFINIVRNCLLS